MNKVFFTADCHFGHAKIIQHCKRPFKGLTEHDQALIANWNTVVKPEDTIYVLGDFVWTNPKHYLPKLNGNKLFIKGNHDKSGKGLLTYLSQIHEIMLDDKRIVLCHYPLASWRGSNRDSWHLHGHCHGKYVGKGKCMDVGVDVNNYTPVSFEQVKAYIENKHKCTHTSKFSRIVKLFKKVIDLLKGRPIK